MEGQGPQLILAHGLGGNMEIWRELGYDKELGKDYKLILVDTRGHGSSDKPTTFQSYNPDVIASDYVAIIDKLKIEKTHYFGYSMGAKIGFFRLARYALPRFYSMILGGISPYRNQAEEQISEERLESLKLTVEKNDIGYYLAYAEKVYGGPLPPQRKALILSRDSRLLLAFTSNYEFWPSAEDVLPKMKIPCLLFAGSADPRYSGAMESVKHMPNATFIPFPGLGHSQCLEQIELVLPLIKKFLAEVNK